MAVPEPVQIPARSIERYRALLGDEDFAQVEEAATRAREAFAGRAIWHVNSTARGGGVAELLHSLLPYARGVGVDTRWVALRESAEFFVVTKRIHNFLHGDEGDGGPLGGRAQRIYETALQSSGEELEQMMQPDDIVYLHDPQTAGLVPVLRELGARVIWRCHIGVDAPGALAHAAWDFLRPYVRSADAYVFSRAEYIWEGLDRDRAWLMPPAIDAFSPKNQEIEPESVGAILQQLGLRADGLPHAPVFVRADGSPGRVERPAEILQDEPVPADARLVVQVSRWDRLKDPQGMLECFERYLDHPDVHLVLAGPETRAVADDPEGAAVYLEVSEAWRRMPAEQRRRAHLVSLPMDDLEENAAMVNAIQRAAEILVQKSLAEGFGLVVAEGMWKAKPMVGSRVGGIQEQIVDGESGILIDDPHDLEAFGAAIRGLLDDRDRVEALGSAARERVKRRFLAVGRLSEYVGPVASLVADSPRAS